MSVHRLQDVAPYGNALVRGRRTNLHRGIPHRIVALPLVMMHNKSQVKVGTTMWHPDYEPRPSHGRGSIRRHGHALRIDVEAANIIGEAE